MFLLEEILSETIYSIKRHKKAALCFTLEIENMYHVSIELYKHEWKFRRTRNVVGTRAAAFSSSPKL